MLCKRFDVYQEFRFKYELEFHHQLCTFLTTQSTNVGEDDQHDQYCMQVQCYELTYACTFMRTW